MPVLPPPDEGLGLVPCRPGRGEPRWEFNSPMKDRIYRWYHDLIFDPDPGGWSGLAKTGLRGLCPLYACFQRLDRYRRVRGRRELPLPVVSVGNLAVGGSGKTEFVSRLTEELLLEGERPAILKRGEGRRTGPVRSGGTAPDELAEAYGDEVALLANRHPDVPIAVGPDRFEAGELLLEENRTVFLLDDGFQHRQLVRDLDLVLIGELDELDNDVLPAGPLREPVSSLRRADVISLPLDSGPSSREELPGDIPVIQHGYRFQAIRREGTDVTAVARESGIRPLLTLARPNRVLETLRNQGIPVHQPVLLPDHGGLSASLLEDLNPENVLVTDKEWVKLPERFRGRVNRLHSTFEVRHLDRLMKQIRRVISDQ